MFPARISRTSVGRRVHVRELDRRSNAGDRSAHGVASGGARPESAPMWTAISGSRRGLPHPLIATVAPSGSSRRSVRKPTSGRSMPSCAAERGGLPKPTFQPSGRSPRGEPRSRASRAARAFPAAIAVVECSSLARTSRRAAGQLVAGGLERARAAPAPDQQHVLVAGVDEAVPVAARREDHVARLRRLAAGVGVDLAAARSSPPGTRRSRVEVPLVAARPAAARSGRRRARRNRRARQSMRNCTCMSIQPSSSRSPCSSGTSSIGGAVRGCLRRHSRPSRGGDTPRGR